MCLIFVNKENQLCNRKAMARALKSNPDGMGLLLWNDNQWQVEKHLTPNLDTILDKLESVSRYAIHYRWGTHGKINLANCHPFAIGEGFYLMHNGILPFTPTVPHRSDTWQFAQYLKAMGVSSFTKKQWKAFFPILRSAIGGDRILIATPSGKLYRLGKWVEKEEGYYSNSSCISSEVITRGIGFDTPLYNPRLDQWDSFEDDPYVIGNYRWSRRGDK